VSGPAGVITTVPALARTWESGPWRGLWRLWRPI